MNAPATTRRSRRRRGGTITQVAALVAAFGLAGAAVLVSPRFVASAEDPGTGGVRARTPEHQSTIDALASLVGRSRAVVSVRQPPEASFFEIVLWLADETNPGRVDASEVAVITHSPALRTLTLYFLPSDENDPHVLRRGRPPLRRPEFPPATLADDAVAAAGFSERWRGSALVGARVLATSVSTARVEARRNDPSEVLLELTLTWSSETTDTEDTASVAVHAAPFRRAGDDG